MDDTDRHRILAAARDAHPMPAEDASESTWQSWAEATDSYLTERGFYVIDGGAR